jgi:HD-GYP domain-containing protein (c-di-GMP phosphodiesterase class II)/DNA-binding CsgD family transcriptional regulator
MLNPEGQTAERLRLADLLAALSLETDLGMGHPPEESMRTCLLATHLARRIGVPEAEVAPVYWTALLMHVGCTAYAHEQAALFGGDEIAVNDVGSRTDDANPGEMLSFLLEIGRKMSIAGRTRLFFVAVTRGQRFGREVAVATCEVAAEMARRLGLPESVQSAMEQLFERWDGKGAPQKLAGEQIVLPARLAQFAAQAMVFDRLGGPAAALEMARRRSGTALDPRLSAAFSRHGRELLSDIASGDPWSEVLVAEPQPMRWIPESGLDGVARAFADGIDLKSVYTLGHSTEVGRLAEAAGRELGMSHTDIVCLRRAGYLHDLGRVGVPNGIWEKSGDLTAAEWEQVRLHPYHSERILSRSPALAPLARIVGMHHERLDGSGYHRGATAASIPMTARVLAAADEYQGLTQDRAFRRALTPSAAADRLYGEARARRLDADAVEAVCAVAGLELSRSVRQGWPAGLTDREVDVLRLLARGLSNRVVGRRLHISPKTVGRHVENIYRKLDISSRAAAALFASQHDLLRGIEDVN